MSVVLVPLALGEYPEAGTKIVWVTGNRRELEATIVSCTHRTALIHLASMPEGRHTRVRLRSVRKIGGTP